MAGGEKAVRGEQASHLSPLTSHVLPVTLLPLRLSYLTVTFPLMPSARCGRQ
jgi:hypothetical protein